MKISIAMCTYNGSRFVEEQLHSIGEQTLQPFELVICDDGSTDTTQQIVEEFAAGVSFPVRFHRNPSQLGSTKNFEKTIQLCRGEAIALCDQDDRWFPEKLSAMSAVLEADPGVTGVFSNARLIDDSGKVLGSDLWEQGRFGAAEQAKFTPKQAAYRLIARDTVTGATFLFRSEYVTQLVPISKEWFHDGWIALILASIGELRPLPACVMDYRLHVSQQVGVPRVAWYMHLFTQKGKALASHEQMVRRLGDMADKLETLPADPGISVALRGRTAFYAGRVRALTSPHLRRLGVATKLLPSYIRYADGMASLLRDILH